MTTTAPEPQLAPTADVPAWAQAFWVDCGVYLAVTPEPKPGPEPEREPEAGL
jgi:hypothetical protein